MVGTAPYDDGVVLDVFRLLEFRHEMHADSQNNDPGNPLQSQSGEKRKAKRRKSKGGGFGSRHIERNKSKQLRNIEDGYIVAMYVEQVHSSSNLLKRNRQVARPF